METQPIQTAPGEPIQELIINPEPMLAQPITIISKALAEIMAGDIRQARAQAIESDDEYKAACSLYNAMRKTLSGAEQRVLDAGADARALAAKVRENGGVYVKPYAGEVNALGNRITAARLKREAEIAAAKKAEEARLAAEAEVKRLADLERDRLNAEAERGRKVATKELNAAANPEQWAEAAGHFDGALAASGTAAAIGLGKATTEALTKATSSIAPAAAPVYIPPALAGKGIKETRTPIIDDFDITTLPMEYHTIDEKKVKAHIKDGTIKKGVKGFPDTPGIVFHFQAGTSPTGR